MEIKDIEQKKAVDLTDIWQDNIRKCYEDWGMKTFPNSVKRLHMSLVDINDEVPLKTEVDRYINTKLERWKEDAFKKWADENEKLSRNPGYCRIYRQDVDYKANQELCNHIIQLLAVHGYIRAAKVDGTD